MYSHLDFPVLGGNGPGYYDSYVSSEQLNASQPAFAGLGCAGGSGPNGRGVSGIQPSSALPGMGGVFGVNRRAIREHGMFGLGAEGPVKDAVIAETTNKLVLVGAGVGLGLALYHMFLAKPKK